MGRGKGGKGREAYKLNINPALLISLIIIIILRIRGIKQSPGIPGLDSAAAGNRTLGCTGWDPDQDRRQDKEQGPLQQPAMDEGSETLVIPQL